MKKIKDIVTLALCASVCLGGVSLSESRAYGQSGTPVTGQDLVNRQKKNQQVYNTLEKGRKEREKHNYRSARAHGQKALRINPDSVPAKAFLENLDVEEKLWAEYQQELKEKKDARKNARKAEREAARAEKQAAKEAARAEKEAAKQALRLEKDAARVSKKAKAPAEIIDVKEEEKPGEDIPESEIKEKEERIVSSAEMREGAAEADAVPRDREMETDLSAFSKPGQAIVVDGDKVEYFEEDGRIVAEGNVSINYGDVNLKCDSIEINTTSRTALCEGNVVITHPEGVLKGDRIRYDLANKEGEIVGGEVKAFPWFGRAEETAKVGPNEYVLKGGFITTCDLDRPHYHLKAAEIRVFPDDKVIAKNVVYYIGEVPVLWVPYYYHPIIDTKAKVQFIPGVTSDWGYFLLSAWRTHIKGNTKVDGLFDYRTKKGFAGGANLYYDLADFGMEGLGHGLLRAYFIDQNGMGTYDPTPFRDEGTKEKWRSRYQWKHRIEFDPETVGMLEFNKMSDEYVLKDYFYNEYEENDTTPQNYISVISSKENYTFSVEANKRFNDFYTVVQKLPEVKIDIFDQRLWETPLYYSSQTSATYFVKDYKFLEQQSEDVGRFDTFQKLAYATGVGPVSVVPYASVRETVYTSTKNASEPVLRSIFGGGVDSFVRFHRVFDVNTDAFGLDINGLRHIVAPKVNYYYTYRPSVSKETLYQMDELDALEHQNGFAVSFENKLQTKRGKGENKASVDLVRSILFTDYSLREKEGGPRFRTIGSELEFRPYDWLYVDNRLEVNGDNWAIKTNSIEGTMRLGNTFQMALGYRYEKKIDEPRNQITFDATWLINPKWRIGLYERFDLEKSKFEEQQLSITRDLHCWEVEATYDVDGSNFFKDDFTFWLAIRLKAFPDLPIGLSRAYEKRAPGVNTPLSPGDPYVPIQP
jgi:LPS-assembly protein